MHRILPAFSLSFVILGIFCLLLSIGFENPFFLNKISYNKKDSVNNYVDKCRSPRRNSSQPSNHERGECSSDQSARDTDTVIGEKILRILPSLVKNPEFVQVEVEHRRGKGCNQVEGRFPRQAENANQ